MSERKNYPRRLDRTDAIWITAVAIAGGIIALIWLN
jgi:hypothetical protein